MTAMHCTHCGGDGLVPGFIEDSGDSSRGHVRWTEGALEIGSWGAIRTGRPHWLVDAYQCRDCSHLVLFTRPQEK
ncbi:hypothetical protein V7968_12845 [Nocardia vulneris]|uniref:hypothetical protein n=1 Tax=Nocardia vulneris TaxID=1141657 RepID=UPI0030CB6894